jgi:hypothetical protein
VLLNLAALHMATQEGQHAVKCCSQALTLDPKSCKALLRRAKALLKIHDYQACPIASPHALFCKGVIAGMKRGGEGGEGMWVRWMI